MRNVIVTGASRGLGLGMARALSKEGYRVVAIARRESEPLSAAAAEAALGGGDIRFVAFDLENLDAIPELVRRLRTDHGPIYGLINNAGIGTEGILATMPTRDIERLVQVNTLAPLVLTKHVVRSMMSASEGRIINMTSIVASTGYNGLSVYAATKASLVGFTHSLAREVGTLGITVNAIAPGFIETDMTANMDEKQRLAVARRSALKRLANVEDIAPAAIYLLSEGARNVTGTVLTVDAGNSA